MANPEGSLPGRSQIGSKRRKGGGVREGESPLVGGGPGASPGKFFKELRFR